MIFFPYILSIQIWQQITTSVWYLRSQVIFAQFDFEMACSRFVVLKYLLHHVTYLNLKNLRPAPNRRKVSCVRYSLCLLNESKE